jgi:hypothetical protein
MAERVCKDKRKNENDEIMRGNFSYWKMGDTVRLETFYVEGATSDERTHYH